MEGAFSPEVASHLVHEDPGRTSEEIVRDALADGTISSTADNPIASQGGALVKMYLAGRLPAVWRDESRRPYRYYPKGSGPERRRDGARQPARTIPARTSFRPSQQQEEALTALVSVGAFPGRTEALHWTLDAGIAAERELIEQALETHKQIERLRKGIKINKLKAP